MKHNHSVFRSTAVVSASIAFSRVLGLVREILMAVLFGTSLAKSAFDIAFLVPNLFRRLFGEGALSAAFVPVFAETYEKEGLESASRLAGRIMSMLIVTLAVGVGVVMLATGAAMKFLPLGERAAATLPLLQIMMPYMFYICLVAVTMAILNALYHFLMPALSPVLMNVVWIGILIFVCPFFGATPAQRIYGAAWGVIAAGSLQLLFQIPPMIRFGIRPVFSLDWNDPRVRRVLALMGPATVGLGFFQINEFCDRLMAILAAPWAPAALTYAERLAYLPLGIFATAAGQVLLPTFSRQVARSGASAIKATLNSAMRNLVLVTMPATVGLAVLAEPLVRVLFVWKGGEFGADSTVYTARAVSCYAPGLVVFSLNKILVPAFYALQDTTTPVRIGIRTILLNFILNLIFVLTWPYGYKHAGLVCATVIANVVNCAWLAWRLHQRIGSPGWAHIAGSWARSGIAALLMGIAVVLGRHGLSAAVAHAGLTAKTGDLVVVLGSVGGGMVVYFALAALLCREEMSALTRRWRR